MDTVRAMELLVLAVSNGSLSGAGRQLRMSPAAVTRHINALEDRIGVRLLNRSSRALTLTEAGRIYYESAQKILQQLASSENQARELALKPSGTVRAHTRLFLGSRYITPAIPEFLRRYPEVDLTLLMSNSDLNLVDHNLDVDIRLGRPRDSGYMLRKLGETRRVVVATPGYLAGAPPLLQPEDLRHHHCVVYTELDRASVWSFRHPGGRQVDVPVTGRFTTDYGPALRDMALAGLGVALLPEWSVEADLAAGRLQPCLPGYDISHFGFDFDNGIYAVFVVGRHTAFKTRVFVDYLVELFRGARPPGPDPV